MRTGEGSKTQQYSEVRIQVCVQWREHSMHPIHHKQWEDSFEALLDLQAHVRVLSLDFWQCSHEA